jgi:hypothetical protein
VVPVLVASGQDVQWHSGVAGFTYMNFVGESYIYTMNRFVAYPPTLSPLRVPRASPSGSAFERSPGALPTRNLRPVSRWVARGVDF